MIESDAPVSGTERRRWIVSGFVQGVRFRMFVLKAAHEAGIERGLTRNLPNGDVEVTAAGSESDLDQLANLLRRGPIAARVDSVTVADAPEAAALPSPFEIRQ